MKNNTDPKINNKTFDEICNNLGLNHLKEFMVTIYNYANTNFDKFCYLFAAVTLIISWIIRTIGFCYQAGRFSIYGIDNKYIEIGDNFLFQLMEYVAITIIFLLVNYFYIYFSIQDDGTRFNFKRKRNISVLVSIEMLGLFIMVLISSYTNFMSAINEIKNTNIITWIFILIILLVSTLMINIFGIEFSFSYKKAHKRKKTSDSTTPEDQEPKAKTDKKIHNSVLMYIVTAFIVTSIFILFSFFGGKFEESQRTSFKIIKETVSDDSGTNLENKNYIFLSGQNKYIIYPIIYENDDIYIVSRLYISTDNITEIDYSYQKVIEKNDIPTYQIDNIHSLKSK